MVGATGFEPESKNFDLFSNVHVLSVIINSYIVNKPSPLYSPILSISL
jgi:hypothetical protein